MKNRLFKMVMFVAGLMPVIASAHTGHDHEAPDAGFLHIVFALSGVMAVWLAGYFIVNLFRKKRVQSQKCS